MSEYVKLKNGQRELRSVVNSVYLNLELLFESDGMAAYDIVMKSRDENYYIFPSNVAKLQAMGLLTQEGKVHDSTREIVLCSVTGEKFNTVLDSPIEGDAE